MAIDDMTNLASWERGRSPVLSFVDLNPMDQSFFGHRHEEHCWLTLQLIYLVVDLPL